MKTLGDKEYNEIWDKVYELLHFEPSCEYRGHSMDSVLPPFKIDGDYSVYGIEDMSDEQIDVLFDRMGKIFADITLKGQMIYALDWQHDSYIYDPHEEIARIGDDCAPGFIPDGDYYFFIESNFEFGYLGHPWREEVWIFGEKLIQAIDEVYAEFGCRKLL